MSIDAATIQNTRATLIDLTLRFGPKLLVAILIMTAGVYVSRSLARRAGRTLHRLELGPPLLAGLGVAGAGIALATQGVLSNVVAGLTIIFTKPYRVGEYASGSAS